MGKCPKHSFLNWKSILQPPQKVIKAPVVSRYHNKRCTVAWRRQRGGGRWHRGYQVVIKIWDNFAILTAWLIESSTWTFKVMQWVRSAGEWQIACRHHQSDTFLSSKQSRPGTIKCSEYWLDFLLYIVWNSVKYCNIFFKI